MPRRALLLVVALAALTTGGCTVGGDEPPAAATAERDEPTLTIAWASDPGSLDPAFARDGTAVNVLLNVMDALVKLDESLEPQPNLAASWDVSEDGRTVTYRLRTDGRWTNGDPVTAEDFEWSWKRTLAPDLDAPNASRLYGIEGAEAYNTCEADCGALERAVGVAALDDRTLEVRLARPQPWFVAQSAHHAFLAVHRETVETSGDEWTDPSNIVTNGPFRLERWDDGRAITLIKDDAWRNADEVALGRVEGRIVPDDATRVQAFDAGEVMVLDGSGLPATDMPALKERREYERYRALGTYYYGFNLMTISDVHQRRAMSLAIDRRALVEHVGRSDELPAIGYTPPGTPGFAEIIGESPWLRENGDVTAAKAELARAGDVKTRVYLLYNSDDGGAREIAEVIRNSWSELGLETTIRGKDASEYLGFLRPPNTGVDVYELGWRYGVADPIDGLAIWTCRSERNYSNFCDQSFDRAIRRARAERDAEARNELYAAAEEALLGEHGGLPLTPIYWYTYPNLEALAVRETFFINPLGQIDLAAVRIE